MFGLLDDDDEVSGGGGQEVGVKVEGQNNDGTSDIQAAATQQAEATDNTAWTDVASTKSRRLAPQWTSTKQETPASASADISKKKGKQRHCYR